MADASIPKNISPIGSEDAFTAWLLSDVATLHVLFCFTEWHEPSVPGGAMDVVFTALAERYAGVEFAKANMDDLPELAEHLELAVVPSFFFFKNKVLADKLEGADAAELASRVERLHKADAPAAGQAVKSLDALTQRLQRLVNASPVMLFMKGTPEEPKCKFSRRAVEILKEAGVSFGSFDILTSQAVRQGLKEMSAWPTYPQLYVKGSLVGGVDILAEMKESGELAAALPARDPTAAPAVLPAPAASAAKPAAAVAAPAPFTGLTPELTERLQALVKRAPVMLFMKGNPAEPKCGFSERMVQLLKTNGVLRFDTFDILSDASVREGLKLLFNWPTFPQLYVKGELIGGLDVVRQMIEEGGGETLPSMLGIA